MRPGLWEHKVVLAHTGKNPEKTTVQSLCAYPANARYKNVLQIA